MVVLVYFYIRVKYNMTLYIECMHVVFTSQHDYESFVCGYTDGAPSSFSRNGCGVFVVGGYLQLSGGTTDNTISKEVKGNIKIV